MRARGCSEKAFKKEIYSIFGIAPILIKQLVEKGHLEHKEKTQPTKLPLEKVPKSVLSVMALELFNTFGYWTVTNRKTNLILSCG